MSCLCVKLSSPYSCDTVLINIDSEIELLSTTSFLSNENFINSNRGIGKTHFRRTKKDKLFIRNGYDDHFHFYYKGRYFLISYNPRSHFLPYARVVVNLDEYTSFNDLIETFTSIWNKKISDYLTHIAIVRRIDFCVDLNKEYTEIDRTLFRPSVKWHFEECSDLESITLGVLSTNSIQHIAYEKNKTRIEARFTGKYCPIKHLIDLTHLDDFNPFEKLFLYDFNINRMDLLKLKPKARKLVEEFNETYQRYGFFKARKRSNKSRNFSKVLMPKLESGIIKYDLYHEWKKNHDKFFCVETLGQNACLNRASTRHKIKKEIMSQKQLMPTTVLKTWHNSTL
jgi:hypothetical protein